MWKYNQTKSLRGQEPKQCEIGLTLCNGTSKII